MNKAAIIAGIASGVVGIGVGASTQPPAPEPEVITETVTEEVEVIKEVEVPVEIVKIPDVCLDALDNGAALIDALDDTTDFLGRSLDNSQSAFVALGNGDMYALDAAAYQLETLASEMNAASATHAGVIPSFENAADACRDAKEGI